MPCADRRADERQRHRDAGTVEPAGIVCHRLSCCLIFFHMTPVLPESSVTPFSDPASAAAVAVQHVSKTVRDPGGDLEILHDIDFSVAAGSITAIVGASGSGKSTLLSIIAGLDTPTRGTVRVEGEDLFDRDEDARALLRARKMGFVFQNFQLLPNLTALENVMLPLELLGSASAHDEAARMLERVGLGQRKRHFPRVMSGGEQQRVALARAFVVGPRVLLADEPTGSLDFATGEAVMNLMFDMNREQGTTLMLVTHDRTLAARCQQRITIAHGQVTDIS